MSLARRPPSSLGLLQFNHKNNSEVINMKMENGVKKVHLLALPTLYT